MFVWTIQNKIQNKKTNFQKLMNRKMTKMKIDDDWMTNIIDTWCIYVLHETKTKTNSFFFISFMFIKRWTFENNFKQFVINL